jgi:hypothetical protein
MKKVFTLLWIIINNTLSAQVIYEHSYPSSYTPSEALLNLIDIGDSQYKYTYTDYSTNELKLFNLDHSPFSTISIPVQLINQNEYWVGYITKSLFDCDSSNLEYAIMSTIFKNNFYIYREDGNLIFRQDSTVPAYCIGCFAGSHDLRPIVNTPNGAKLFLLKSDTSGFPPTVDVYSLCGTLTQFSMTSLSEISSYVKVFPNPTSGQIYFRFDLLDLNDCELNIYDTSGNIVQNISLNSLSNELHLNVHQFNSGQYYFTLKSKNKMLQNGKFIITN